MWRYLLLIVLSCVLPRWGYSQPAPLSFNCTIVENQIEPGECKALMEFYNQVGGDEWSNNEGWFENIQPDKEDKWWYGITIKDRHVVKIELANNHLVGQLPVEQICELTHLKTLNLGIYKYGSNKLTLGPNTPFPDCLNELKELDTLILSSIKLENVLLSSFHTLPSITYLNLSGTGVKGDTEEICGLNPKLETLVINSNSGTIIGGIPSCINQLTELKILVGYTNQLTGAIPTELCDLKKLEILDLNSNGLTEDIPSCIFEDLTQLSTLSLIDNKLTMKSLADVCQLTQLTTLHLGINPFPEQKIPECIGHNLKSLQRLHLSELNLVDLIPSLLGNLLNLKELILNNNKLQGPIPASFGNLTHLRKLWLHDTQLQGPIPPEFTKMVLTNLKLVQLYLDNNYFTLEDCQAIQKMKTRGGWIEKLKSDLNKGGFAYNPQKPTNFNFDTSCPALHEDLAITKQDTPVTIEVLANDFDLNIDAIIASASGNQHCTIDNDTPLFCSKLTDSPGQDVALGDVNHDKKTDAVFVNSDNNQICLGNGLGGFSSCQTIGTSPAEAVAIGDINGDQNLDVVFASANNQICLGSGTGHFNNCSNINGIQGTSSEVLLADINLNNDLDAIFVTDTFVYNCLNKNNKFGCNSIQFPISVTHIDLADLNQDGKFDYILSDSNSVWYCINNNDKTCENFYDDGAINAISVTDLNNDFLVDVILSTSTGDNLIYTNKGEEKLIFKGFTPPASAINNFQSQSIVKTDLNRDGNPDLIFAGVSDQSEVCFGQLDQQGDLKFQPCQELPLGTSSNIALGYLGLNLNTMKIATPPLNGQAHINPDGSITYTPNLYFNGQDSFNYQIEDLTTTVTVQVAPATATLSINFEGPGRGQVRSEPGNIQCTVGGDHCSQTYQTDVHVKLIAQAEPGSRFVSWQGDGCDHSVLIKTDMTCTAYFDLTPSTTKTLSVSLAGPGQGQIISEPVGIHCYPGSNNCSYPYKITTQVKLIPQAEPGSRFNAWINNEHCHGGPDITLLMTNTLHCTAYFELQPHNLTLKVNGQGQISSTDNIQCSDHCTYELTAGTALHLTAQAAAGWQFQGWQNSDCGTDLILNADQYCEAVFVPVWPLTVTVTGSGQVSTEDGQLNCDQHHCQGTYPHQQTVTLIASPADAFQHWSGDCSGSSPQTPVTLDNAKTCQANFTQTPQVTLTINNTGHGRVRATGIDCGDICHATYALNTPLNLITLADPGYEVHRFEGDCAPKGQLLLTADQVCTVYFKPITTPHYTLSVTKTGQGVLSSQPLGIYCGEDCQARYPEQTHITLIPQAAPNFSFAGFEGDCAPKGHLTLQEDSSCQAHFEPQTATLAINIVGAGHVTSETFECNNNCEYHYPFNTALTLTATAAEGWYLKQQTCQETPLYLDHHQTCQFWFAPEPGSTPSLHIGVNGAGKVSSDANGGIDCLHDCVEYYPQATQVTLTAYPEASASFSHWDGDCQNETNPLTRTITQSQVCSAHFITPPQLQFTADHWQVAEHIGHFNFAITLLGNLVGSISAQLTPAVTDDYHINCEPLQWSEDMPRTKSCSVSVIDDEHIEAPERFSLMLTAGTIAQRAELTILDNDCQGNAWNSQGELVSQVCFIGHIQTAAGMRPNHAQLTPVEAQQVELSATIKVAPQHVGQAAQLYKLLLPGSVAQSNSAWQALEKIEPFENYQQLPEQLDVFLHQHDLSQQASEYTVLVSYRLADGQLFYNGGEPIHFFIEAKPLAVDLLHFKVTVNGNPIILTWQTATEQDNAGFHLWRAAQDNHIRLTPKPISAQGDARSGARYRYEDYRVMPGKRYDYVLESIDLQGNSYFHQDFSASAQLE